MTGLVFLLKEKAIYLIGNHPLFAAAIIRPALLLLIAIPTSLIVMVSSLAMNWSWDPIDIRIWSALFSAVIVWLMTRKKLEPKLSTYMYKQHEDHKVAYDILHMFGNQLGYVTMFLTMYVFVEPDIL